jgi:3-hydroxymyristoyl/3-hydroxydecanoyl-(acyl carrier protein) dehydratase
VGHFPNQPVVPGVVILEQVLAGLIDCGGYCSSYVRQIKFESMLHPDELAKISYQINADKCAFEVSAVRENSKIVMARGTLMIDLAQACHEVG